MDNLSAEAIAEIVSNTIEAWHRDNSDRPADYIILNEKILKRKAIDEHRNNLEEVIEDLINTNLEMWHEEDKVRSDIDAVVLKAIRNINPLNQHRNDLIEEIDEIFIDKYSRKNKNLYIEK